MAQYNTCLWCGKKINKLDNNHIYRCEKRPKELTNDEVKLKYIAYKLNSDESIIQNIIDDYTNLYSLPMLHNKYGIDSKSVYFILNYYNIPIRTISESAKLISQEKYKKTCLKRYGVTNVSQTKEIQKKKEETFLKHYGVDNIWKTKDYTLNIWNSFSEEKKRDIIERRYKSINENKTFGSKIELKVLEVLDNLNISYQRFYLINGYKHPYDIYLNNTKILIEINGSFWHADPKKYNPNDKLPFPGKKRGILAKDIWKQDEKNIKKANKKGYKVITIWEDEINKPIEELTKYIIDLLNS